MDLILDGRLGLTKNIKFGRYRFKIGKSLEQHKLQLGGQDYPVVKS